jgi:cytochrome c peroxidase
LYAALAAGVVGAGGYYFYGTSATPAERVEELKTVGREAEQIAEAKTGLGLKKQEDYQKVYNRIAEMLEQDDYDGESGEVEMWSVAGYFGSKSDGTHSL